MAIRFDRSLMSEMRRVVKNFNAKRRRLEKQGQKVLPEKVSVKDLMSFSRRRELYSTLNDLRAFSKRGAENVRRIEAGLITEWEFKTVKERARRSKISLARRISSAELREPHNEYKSMAKDYIKNMRYKKEYLSRDIKKLSSSQFKTFKKIIEQREDLSRINEVFYENFFDMLFKDAYIAGIDPYLLDYIEQTLRQLSPNQLADAFREVPALSMIVERYNQYVGVDKSNVPYLKFHQAYFQVTQEEQLDKAIRFLGNRVEQIVAQYS